MNKEDVEFLKYNGFDSLLVTFNATKRDKEKVESLKADLEKTEELYLKYLKNHDGFNESLMNRAIEKIKSYIREPNNEVFEEEAEIAIVYLECIQDSLV